MRSSCCMRKALFPGGSSDLHIPCGWGLDLTAVGMLCITVRFEEVLPQDQSCGHILQQFVSYKTHFVSQMCDFGDDQEHCRDLRRSVIGFPLTSPLPPTPTFQGLCYDSHLLQAVAWLRSQALPVRAWRGPSSSVSESKASPGSGVFFGP